MIIDLIRHTTPDIDLKLCYGQTDLELKPSFPTEFEIVRQKLHSKYDLIISSPLQRCLKLAKTLDGETLIQDPRVMEYNFGDWELLPWANFTSTQAQEWMNNFVDQAAPNGDSIVSMQQRVLSFWGDLLSRDLQQVAVVTHSGVQRLLHAHILETPLSHLFRLELDFGAVIRITHKTDSQLCTIKHL